MSQPSRIYLRSAVNNAQVRLKNPTCADHYGRRMREHRVWGGPESAVRRFALHRIWARDRAEAYGLGAIPTQLRLGLPTKPRPWPAAWAAQPPATRPLKIDGPSMVPSRPARPLMWPPAMPATSPAA